MKRDSPKQHVIIFAFYVGFAALILNVLILHFHEYVGLGKDGYTDYYHSIWNYWWIRHALTTPDLKVYYTDYVMYPLDNNLGLHTLAPFWFPLWALLEPLTNIFVATNSIFWVGLTLTGYCTYLFLRDQGSQRGIALLGGSLMAAQPVFFWASAMTLPVYIDGFWYPVAFLCWTRVVRTRRVSWAVLTGLIFWGMVMTSHSTLLCLAVVLVPFGVKTLIDTGDKKRLVILGFLAVAIVLVLGWFIAPLRPMFAFDRSALSPARVESIAEQFSLQFSGLLPYAGDGDRSVGSFIGLLTFFTIFRRNINDRLRWFWFSTGVVAVVLAFGPYIPVNEARIPLPFWLIYEIIGGIFRTPMRFAAPGILMLLVFIGRSWSPSVVRWRPGVQMTVLGLLLVLIMADLRVLKPIPAGPPTPAYEFHKVMAQEPENYVVIDVPVSIGSGWVLYGDFQEAQFYGTTHGKRMINGLIARVPDTQYGNFIYDDTIGWLGGFQPFQPEIQRPRLQSIINDWFVGYIVVHQDHLFPGQKEEIIGFLNSLDYLCPVTVEGTAIFYRTSAHPGFGDCPPRHPSRIGQGTWEVDFGTPGDEMFIGLGFHGQEIIGGPTGRWLGARDLTSTPVYLVLPPDSDYTMTLEATAFNQPRSLALFIEDTPIAEFEVSDQGYGQYSAQIPAELLGESGEFTLRLVYDTPVSAAELGASGDERPISIALNWIRFTQSH